MSLFKKFIAIGSLLIILGGLALVITIGVVDPQLWWWIVIILIAIYGINIIFAIYVFYSKKRNSVEKKCWMMVLMILPILGVFAYIKYGFNAFHKTSVASQLACRTKLNKMDMNHDIHLESENNLLNFMSKYCQNSVNNYPNIGDVKVIDNIENLYKVTINSIRNAKKIIFINFYIISDGIWLRSIVNELKKKADQGVKIYFLFDWGGSNKRYPKDLINSLRVSGISINLFRPKKLLYVSSYDNARSHKKMIIIDNEICFNGGFNMADEYINYSSEYEYWSDDAFIIRGNIVKEYIKTFVSDWVVYSDDKESKEIIFKHISESKLFECVENNKNNCEVQLFDSNPELQEYQMINFLIMCFNKAQKRIWINTPYLYPTEYLINVLISLAQAGLDIRIMTPGLVDNKKFILSLNRSQYQPLINAGIKIYEMGAFHHSKTIIIDDEITLIGTCNLDPRAMNLNYENVSIVKNTKFNKELSNKFLDNIKYSREITTDEWKQLSLKSKILVKLLMLWEPLF